VGRELRDPALRGAGKRQAEVGALHDRRQAWTAEICRDSRGAVASHAADVPGHRACAVVRMGSRSRDVPG
jgi:hypothetical protein